MTDLIKRDDDLLWPSAYVGTPEQLLNCLIEMWRREKRVTVSAVLHATIETLRALPAVTTHRYAGESEASVYDRKGFPPIGLQGHAHAPVADRQPAIDPATIREAALQARIEELEKEQDEALANQTYTYIGKDMKPILARDLEDAKDAAEAKLTKAVEALREIKSVECVHCTDYFHELADAVLAELEGKE